MVGYGVFVGVVVLLGRGVFEGTSVTIGVGNNNVAVEVTISGASSMNEDKTKIITVTNGTDVTILFINSSIIEFSII